MMPGVPVQRIRRLRSSGGFTLIELLIVVAIIGMLAAMLIPNLLDALQKAKQKRVVADLRLTGTSMMAWLTDQSSAAAAGSSGAPVDITSYPLIDYDSLSSLLVPQYIQQVPLRDSWKVRYQYRLQTTDTSADSIMAIRSGGSNITFEGNTYTSGAFDPTDYACDIVWTDGFFVRWPEKTAN